MMFPIEYVIAGLAPCAVQLSQSAPVQYQEYDRLRAEAELRMAVAPPLVILVVLLPVSAGPWLIVAGTVSALVLLLQAARNVRASYDLLAHSANLDYLEVPLIKSVAAALEKIDPKPTSRGEWIAAIIVGLEELGFYDEWQSTLDEAAELDQPEDREAVLRYLQKFGSDSVGDYEMRLEMRRLDRSLAEDS